MIAVGAILHWAVTAHSSTINIQRAGTILLVVGIVALLISLWWVFSASEAQARRLRDY
jgi:hypothetical protein